jgi:formylglycine-generating enzyme required for sulfatase activity
MADRFVFGWDNEFPRHTVDVRAFSIERHEVTDAAFLEFVDAGGYANAQWWRPEHWEWVQREGVTHPLFWESRNGTRKRPHSLGHFGMRIWSVGREQ